MTLEQQIQEDIKAANKTLAGQSDGRTISTVVKELLS
jgi:uncharacterized protein YqeY